MTQPSDFTPDRALEVDQPVQPDTKSLQQHIWLSRALGLLLLSGALFALGIVLGPGSAAFFVSAGVLVAFTTYVLIAEARTRRMSLNLEKRLRLGLLVHNMELENMAMQDDLTQLFNRRYLFDRLERELDTAKAFKRPLSVIVVDLNSMKQVNDTYGHRVGDEMLSAFGRFLLDHTRASDVPARIGGDEFAIILPDTNEGAAHNLKIRLVKRLEAVNMIDRDGLRLTASASFGVAGYPATGETVDDLMNQADSEMYSEKRQSKRSEVATRASLMLEKADAS